MQDKFSVARPGGEASPPPPAGTEPRKSPPLSYARTLSWLSFLVILLTSLALSFSMSNSARQTLLTRQEDFARLLAQNLNHQIHQRFAIPTLLAYGRIALREPGQRDRLDEVVRAVIHGLSVSRLRIYDFSRIVAYSSDRAEMGRMGLAPPGVEDVLAGRPVKAEILAAIPDWQAPFRVPLAPGTFTLRLLYPLRGDPMDSGARAPVTGALELLQDITGDYEKVLAFQGIIFVMCLLSSVVLFGLMLMIIQRAERVLAERMQQNSRLEQELHDSERLAAMGRVVAGIAHEIRNPLGIIRSSAELLLRRSGDAPSAERRLLSAMHDESVRLSQTVNDFLDYARPRAPRMDPVDIQQVLDEVMAFLEGDMGRSGLTVERGERRPLMVRGDKDLLYRAFYNVMVNAQQAMGGRGLLIVDAVRDGAEARISFRDTGPGIDPDVLPRLLDPFFTTKENGTGLGLPIVQSIVAGHGGRLEAANARQGGAEITVFLPAIPAADGAPDPGADAAGGNDDNGAPGAPGEPA